MTKEQELLSAFKEDVISGLKAKRKRLPSKYFYDSKGDALFQEIMGLDEYYLTRKETAVFNENKEAIYNAFSSSDDFRLVELGAGDGTKTKILLKHFLKNGASFTYTPIDISNNALTQLADNLNMELPNLEVQPEHGDYFKALERIHDRHDGKRTILFFLGSNIGNFGDDGDVTFLTKLGTYLDPGDLFFMGVDLKKDPSIILKAYNDAKGVTKQFNYNLLDRINRELDGNFINSNFMHYPYYNPQSGECRSYLISTTDQDVVVAGEKIHFAAWEAIFMEISKKFDEQHLSNLASAAEFKVITEFKDDDAWFANVLWEKV